MDFSVISQVFTELFGEYWGFIVLTIICTVSAIAAAFCPAPTEESSWFYKAIYKVINFFAVNVGKAKNADDVKAQESASVTK